MAEEENVKLVREAHAAYAREGIDGLKRYLADDAEIHTIPEWSEAAEYRGPDGYEAMLSDWLANYGFSFRLLELHEAGPHVVGLYEIEGLAKRTGVPMDIRLGAVHSENADGKIGLIRYFSSWPKTFEAVGVFE